MEWGKQMKLNQDLSKLSLYQNTNYNYERIEQTKLIIDVNMSISGTLDNVQTNERSSLKKFKLKLSDPLIIDSLSDIYLESFMTWNGIQQNSASGGGMAYILKINEFRNSETSYATNIYTSNASQSFINFDEIKENSILIPVRNTSGNTYDTHICDCEKFISTINPTTIFELNGTITDNGILYNNPNGIAEDGKTNIEYNSAFTQKYGRFIATFIIKKRCYC